MLLSSQAHTRANRPRRLKDPLGHPNDCGRIPAARWDELAAECDEQNLHEFLCPIKLTLMMRPAALSCGHVFELEAIRGWRAKEGVCPLDRNPIEEVSELPGLRKRIHDFVVSLLSPEEIELYAPQESESSELPFSLDGEEKELAVRYFLESIASLSLPYEQLRQLCPKFSVSRTTVESTPYTEYRGVVVDGICRTQYGHSGRSTIRLRNDGYQGYQILSALD